MNVKLYKKYTKKYCPLVPKISVYDIEVEAVCCLIWIAPYLVGPCGLMIIYDIFIEKSEGFISWNALKFRREALLSGSGIGLLI